MTGLEGEDDQVQRVAQEIMGYLRRHPQAADSLEGIASWWVPQQRIRNEVEVVKAALDSLIDAGVLVATSERSGRPPVYRLKRSTH